MFLHSLDLGSCCLRAPALMRQPAVEQSAAALQCGFLLCPTSASETLNFEGKFCISSWSVMDNNLHCWNRPSVCPPAIVLFCFRFLFLMVEEEVGLEFWKVSSVLSTLSGKEVWYSEHLQNCFRSVSLKYFLVVDFCSSSSRNNGSSPRGNQGIWKFCGQAARGWALDRHWRLKTLSQLIQMVCRFIAVSSPFGLVCNCQRRKRAWSSSAHGKQASN